MAKQVYKVGNYYSIGVFYNGELQRGLTPKYYKTFAGATRALSKNL